MGVYNRTMPKHAKAKQEIHPSHAAETPKLNRAIGQLEGVKTMIAENRYCPDIITQLRAARAAIRSIEAKILETHLQHCVADVMLSGDKKETQERIEDLKKLFKRFDD